MVEQGGKKKTPGAGLKPESLGGGAGGKEEHTFCGRKRKNARGVERS